MKQSLMANVRFVTHNQIILSFRGPRFERVLSEAKSDVLEGDRASNPTGRLIYRVLHEFERR